MMKEHYGISKEQTGNPAKNYTPQPPKQIQIKKDL